jgi:hypothetical protein
VSVAAAALALAREFPFGDRVLRLHPLDWFDLAAFSVWCEDRARAGMARAAGDVDAKTLAAGHLEAVASGTFEPGGGAFDAATKTEAGNRKILELMLLAPDGERDPARWRAEAAWEVYEDEAAFAAVMGLAARMNADPGAKKNRRRPRAWTDWPPPAAPSPSAT